MGASFSTLEDQDARLTRDLYDDPKNHNQKQYLLVAGYLRRFNHQEFPEDLIRLCLTMYYMYVDTWHYQQGYRVATKYNSIECVSHPYDHGYNNAWRVVVGNLSVERGMVVEWKFKIITNNAPIDVDNYTPQVIVGICDERKAPESFNLLSAMHMGNNDMTLYGYYVANGDLVRKGQIDSYGNEWIKGDTIKMILNLQGKGGIDTGSLSFEVNGVPQGQSGGIAVNDLDLDKTYKMMMSCEHGEKVQLVL